jgi:aryl-phospho-beta-D-glucosidase BglC (GH1 family)
MRKSSFKAFRTVAALALSAMLVVGSFPNKAVKVDAESTTNKTATEVVADMTAGWNIGNTLDATGTSAPARSSNETAWGNPAVTRQLIEAVGAAGFNTIRVPVSWGQYTTGSNYQIPDFWMSRVKEVVDYCIDNGMYVILNTHHDTNYYSPTNARKYESEKYFKSIWTQVGNKFKNYDSHLIFETMNEPRLVGTSDEWWFPRNNPSNAVREAISCINDYNQVALDAIRATGGNNATRCVMVPGYDASYDGCMVDSFKLPRDSASGRLIVSVHAYTPYDFALNANGTNTFTDRSALDSLFSDLGSKFLSKGTPVVIGEMGASNKNNTSERVKWADYYWSLAERYNNIALCLWDNNIYYNPSDAGEAHQYIDRSNLQWKDPAIIQTIMKHVNGTPAKSDKTSRPAPSVAPSQRPSAAPSQKPSAAPSYAPSAGGLKVVPVLNDWGSGFEYQITLKNEGATVNNWQIKVKKSDMKINNSWCVNIAESGDYYVITPMSWNAAIGSGQSITFGLQGSNRNGQVSFLLS